MSETGQTLLELAEKQFPDLSGAEKKLINAAAAGQEADYRSDDADTDDPGKWEHWGPQRTIRAEVIRWLCVDVEAVTPTA